MSSNFNKRRVRQDKEPWEGTYKIPPESKEGGLLKLGNPEMIHGWGMAFEWVLKEGVISGGLDKPSIFNLKGKKNLHLKVTPHCKSAIPQ